MATARHADVRDVLVVLLTLTTGVVDATCFLGLGGVFSSVVTGNLVLLGVAAGGRHLGLAARSGVAVAGYAVGVAAGAPVAARRTGEGGTWPPNVSVTLAVEMVLLAGFCAAWDMADGHPTGGLQAGLVAVLAAAMGMQGAAVRRLGEMSTTYLTGTLTGVVAGLVTRARPEGFRRSLGILAAIITGAAAGSAVLTAAPRWLPVAVLVPPGLVVVGSLAGFTPVRDHFRAGRGG